MTKDQEDAFFDEVEAKPAKPYAHIDMALIAYGACGKVADYLRHVADALDMGATSGISRPASQVIGRWFSK